MDNFESDTIGHPAKNWTIGHDGKDDSKVIQDPKRAKNKVFSSPTERHDAKGAIYITGKGKDWTDYYVHWDMLYPKDFIWESCFDSLEANLSICWIEGKIPANSIFGSEKKTGQTSVVLRS